MTLRLVVIGSIQRDSVAFGHLVGIVTSADAQIVSGLQPSPGAEVDVDNLMQPKDVVEVTAHDNRAVRPGQSDAKHLEGDRPGLRGKAAFVLKRNHNVSDGDRLATDFNFGDSVAILKVIDSQVPEFGIEMPEVSESLILPREVFVAVRIAQLAEDAVKSPDLVAGAGQKNGVVGGEVVHLG